MGEQLSAADLQRFSRHIILPQVGMEGQVRLRNARVAVVGAGGLGSPVILYLAAAGIGHLTIIDDDAVDLSNLQRQILHDAANVGVNKAVSARLRIHALDDSISVTVVEERLTSVNALSVLEGHDVVVDGTDNFPTRYLVNDACEMLGITWVYGSVHRFEGQVSVFNLDGGVNYRDIFPKPPPPGMVPSCAEGGVLGVLPGVIGTLQANEVLKLVLGIGQHLSGILMLYDALEMRFRGVRATKDSTRPVVTELMDLEGYCANAQVEVQSSDPIEGMVQEISPVAIVEKMDAGWAPYVLDVRSIGEGSIASISFVDDLIPHVDVLQHLDSIPSDRDILFYCHHGSRSMMAAMMLASNGWDASRLWNMAGGIDLWSLEVDSTIPRY
jgi:molybdopterin/thiamine biosynthesis adenylyltransferase/rhodanese-related sulfurtransferase